MASQVLSFLRPTKRVADWSQEEIAELYRIEHALVQARFTLETDRGLSDEGDPWFVFCKGDGEVLVHITRSDEGYFLYGLGLLQPLRGRVIGELSKSFVNQIPLNVTVRRNEGTKLFVHPAATLAIIIAMIFAAHDDDAFFAYSDPHEAVPSADPIEPIDASLKSWAQSLLGKLVDGILPGASRSESNHQEGAYLNLVCTIAAVMIGATTIFDADISVSDPAVSQDASYAVETTTDQPASPDPLDGASPKNLASSIGSQFESGHTREVVAFESDHNEVQGAAASSNAGFDAQPTTKQQVFAGVPVLDNEKPNLSADETLSDSSRPNLQNEAPHVRSAPNSLPESVAEAPKPVSISAATVVPHDLTSIQHEGGNILSVELVLSQQQKTMSPPAAAPGPVLAPAALEILQSIPAAPSEAKEDSKSEVKDNTTEDVAHAEHGKLYPLFDTAAHETLTKFLQSNPDSQAYFYDHNVIIYDGDKDFSHAPVTVTVWEFDTGATIAIVGHADNPTHG